MIHWILAYKHPIFIRQAFLRHPATSLPRAHSPPRPLLRYRLRRRGRRDRNLLFLNFSATPRARTIRRKFLAKLFEKVSKYLIIRLRKIRYGKDDGIVDIDQAHQAPPMSVLFVRAGISVRSGFPFDSKRVLICLIFSHDRRSRA